MNVGDVPGAVPGTLHVPDEGARILEGDEDRTEPTRIVPGRIELAPGDIMRLGMTEHDLYLINQPSDKSANASAASDWLDPSPSDHMRIKQLSNRNFGHTGPPSKQKHTYNTLFPADVSGF